MNIQEYQLEAKRTCLDLGLEINRQHMLLGIISEIGEIADAYKKELAYQKVFDRVNLKEECADVSWYLANWASFNNISLVDLKEVTLSSFLEDKDNAIDYLFGFIETNLHMGNPQYTFNAWYTTCLKLGLTEEEFYQSLENNINKLKVRFPEKFTQENALNRDLELERKELEK